MDCLSTDYNWIVVFMDIFQSGKGWEKVTRATGYIRAKYSTLIFILVIPFERRLDSPKEHQIFFYNIVTIFVQFSKKNLKSGIFMNELFFANKVILYTKHKCSWCTRIISGSICWIIASGSRICIKFVSNIHDI